MASQKYQDIIGLPHHRSRVHPPMSEMNRAAQFSPFAALTGHEDAIRETARLTEDKIELDETMKEALNRRLQFLEVSRGEEDSITLLYFRADEKKAGGAYNAYSGQVKKVDSQSRELVFRDGMVIPMDDIIEIDGDLFKGLAEK